jgi:hypothetical protein
MVGLIAQLWLAPSTHSVTSSAMASIIGGAPTMSALPQLRALAETLQSYFGRPMERHVPFPSRGEAIIKEMGLADPEDRGSRTPRKAA